MASLEEQALERKARLKALRAKREGKQDSQNGGPNQTEGSKPQLKFRSYIPQTEDLKERRLPKAKPEDVGPQIKDQLEAAKDAEIGEVNLANLAPRKVDWDLKRDIAKKLEKLERRTQKAIVEIIRDRLQAEDNANLASAVATAGNEQQQYDSD